MEIILQIVFVTFSGSHTKIVTDGLIVLRILGTSFRRVGLETASTYQVQICIGHVATLPGLIVIVPGVMGMPHGLVKIAQTFFIIFFVG